MEWGLNVVMFMEIIIEYMSFFYIIFRKNLCVSFFKKFLYFIPVIILLVCLGFINRYIYFYFYDKDIF